MFTHSYRIIPKQVFGDVKNVVSLAVEAGLLVKRKRIHRHCQAARLPAGTDDAYTSSKLLLPTMAGDDAGIARPRESILSLRF